MQKGQSCCSRWDKSYESCELDKLPHTCLTKPCKALEFFFEGDSKGRGRDNIMKLEVIAAGLMNAVAFWFDLHLDEQVSLCTGKAYQGSTAAQCVLCVEYAKHPII